MQSQQISLLAKKKWEGAQQTFLLHGSTEFETFWHCSKFIKENTYDNEGTQLDIYRARQLSLFFPLYFRLKNNVKPFL